MIKSPPQPEQLVGRMDSLADPTRLRLLRLLERHELGVVELCDVLQLPQSTVSRHLKVLADQGWTQSQRRGTNNLYRMPLDELDPAARRLWLLAREQTEEWATIHQDQLRLQRHLQLRGADSQAFFAGAAAEWDKLRGELYGEGFNRAALAALLPPQWTVADLGCGTGATTAQLATGVQRVIGVDQSAAMLKAAKARCAGLDNVQLRRGDLLALPIDDTTCDAALLTLVLAYLSEPEAALRQAARILKPGGRLVIVDLLPHDRDDFRRQTGQACMGFSRQRMQALLEQAGLKLERFRELPPESRARGPALFLAAAGAQGSPKMGDR